MKQELNLTTLSVYEMESIVGGNEDLGPWGKVAFYIGLAARSLWEFSRSAMEYQASLPPNLKK
jgi:hypothetical protein